MTAAFLQSELASLIQDSKRRQSDVRTAAEKSLADLKAIQVTSETQLAGDLLRRPHFIDPFILACHSKYAKLAVTGAICLQRLVASRAIPPARLADMLDAFQEASQQGLDVQLKILQALPSLLQLYATELYGDALAKVLSLCASMAGSKTGLVSSSAIATFQQLITALFDKQARKWSSDDDRTEDTDDAGKIFEDMCMIIKGEQPHYLRSQGITLPLALEVIEMSLSIPKIAILDTSSCLKACEDFLLPGINLILEKSASFSAFGRSLRVLYLLITRELERTLERLSEPLVTLLGIMDRPSGPPWRRISCLEFMRNVINEPQLFRTIYSLFDRNDQRRSIVGDLMSILVRIAAEDPALIGLGRQSTIPTNSESDNASTGGAAVDIDAVGSVLQANSNVTGISSRWSTMNNQLLDQLEASANPDIPETYVYTLVLGCVASLSDGLSKFVMPLSVPNRWALEAIESTESNGIPSRKNSSQARRAEKYQRLLNPLKREDLPGKEEVEVCAKLIEDCWPAVLATCSTFLNSALDSHFYHILVRTVQKLAQVSGVLELFTPRDALLTTLAKVSVPVNASAIVNALHGNKLAKMLQGDEENDEDEASVKSPVLSTPRISVDFNRQPLNVRNLLCLRALLNLGIALGPTLSEASWFIIIQALQQADALMSVNPATRAAASKAQTQDEVDTEGQTSLGSEITAVGTASKRMMESTKTYSDEMLEVFLHSLFRVIDTLIRDVEHQQSDAEGPGQLSVSRKHKVTRSISGSVSSSVVLFVEAEFALKTINDISRINLYRFCSHSSQSCTWHLIVVKLLAAIADSRINPQLRLQAAGILNSISMEAMKMLEKQEQGSDERNELQNTCLNTLGKQLSVLYKKESVQPILVTDVDIHRRMLEALEDIVSHCGDSLTSGWRIVFDILQRTSRQTETISNGDTDEPHVADQGLILERTIPPAFRVIQLIVSDFLSTIDPLSFSNLIQLLRSFGIQRNDLNISLTTTVLFSNLSSLLLERSDEVDIPISPKDLTKRGTERSTTTERKPSDVSSLWFAVVLQLCILCKDIRSDVRNSALRVLVRILESSNTQSSASTWNAVYQEAILPVLKEYCGKPNETLGWHLSYTQLLQGSTTLFVQNVEVITKFPGFADTWTDFTDVFRGKLEERDLDGYAVVFSSAAELLRALYSITPQDTTYVLPILNCWYENHPANMPIGDRSNQDALCAHAQLFSAIINTAGSAINDFAMDGRSLPVIAMAATKQAALASMHPPYSSDVTKLASEQSAIVDNLDIIKSMMFTKKQGYTTFILDLVNSILTRNTAIEVKQQTISKESKHFKRPTLIALMSSCISLLRRIIQEETTSNDFLEHSAARDGLVILTKVAASKYSDIPSNNEMPVWQNATSALVELVEAMRQHIDRMSTAQIIECSQPIVQALQANITAPFVEVKQPPPSIETITKDEIFDTDHFTRLHAASQPLLQQFDFPNEHRKQYVVSLFNASLVAKPWFGDLPSDLLNHPLSKFNTVRAGSIRPSDLLPRIRIPYEMFEALVTLVDSTVHLDEPSTLIVARAAAPYVLLRIAHPIKNFIADQRLRNLIPPPRPLLRELNVVLNKALELKVIDGAFAELVPGGAQADDGKTHLRVLYPLILRLKEFWVRLPRLKVCAWQDGEDGLGVRRALDAWGTALAGGWGV